MLCQNRRKSIFVLFVVVGYMLFSILSNVTYTDVDNYNVATVVNGLYDKDNYTYYLHPCLCLVLRIGKTIIPQVDIYSCFFHAMLAVIIATLVYEIVFNSISNKLLWVMVILSFAVATNLYNANYTIYAALCTAVGFLEIVISMYKTSRKRLLLGTLLVCIGMMWRKEGSLLAFPFVMLFLVLEVMQCPNKALFIKKVARSFGWCIILIAVLFLSSNYINSSEKYYDAIEYSKARTLVEDFPVEEYDVIKNDLNEVSQVEYEAAKGWFLFDTDNITAETFHEIKTASSMHENRFNFSYAVNKFVELIRSAWAWRRWLVPAGFIVIACILKNNIEKNSWSLIAGQLLAIGGAAIILYYFCFLGRDRQHVWLSVIAILIVYAVATSMCLRGGHVSLSVPPSCKWRKLVAGIFISAIIIGFIPTIKKAITYDNTRFIQNEIKLEETYSKTIWDDSLYIWTGWHSEITQTHMACDSLISREFLQHNIPVGDWTYGQNYFNRNLESIMAANPAESLLERPNTFLVAKDPSFVVEYLKEIYGYKGEVHQVTTINNLPVWSFQD